MSPRVVALVTVAATLLLGAAPAAPPDHPVSFIGVDQLKAHLDAGGRADIVDVRRWDAYVRLHIRGARSMPLRAVPARAHEISRTELVVLY